MPFTDRAQLASARLARAFATLACLYVIVVFGSACAPHVRLPARDADTLHYPASVRTKVRILRAQSIALADRKRIFVVNASRGIPGWVDAYMDSALADLGCFDEHIRGKRAPRGAHDTLELRIFMANSSGFGWGFELQMIDPIEGVVVFHSASHENVRMNLRNEMINPGLNALKDWYKENGCAL